MILALPHVATLTIQALIYPGLGLGTILSKAKVMTDKMIVAGAQRLGELAPALKDAENALLPDFGGELCERVIHCAEKISHHSN